MHKLVDYICEELDELERKADKNGKLSMSELQYADILAHTKKNLLKGEEMMDGGTSHRMEGGNMMYSGARGRGRNAKRDSMGRYSSERDGRSYDDRSYRYDGSYYGDMSYADEMQNLVDSIHGIMNDLPENAKADAQRFVKKLEQM